jgi:nitrate/nitrite transporter NarK
VIPAAATRDRDGGTPDAGAAGERRAWLIWGVGVAAYVVAVFHRASLGVAGVQAEHRFGLTAATLSLLGVVQLATYAALQIPVGLLLDRLGSRRMIALGALVMAAGQALLATGETVPAAVAARILVGAGDAMTFISVLRLVPAWFPARRAPVVSQLTGILGQSGQIMAAFPLVALLGAAGWTRSFLAVAALGVLAAVLVLAVLRDVPAGGSRPAAMPLREVRADLGRAWREPGTQIGLWTHFVTQFSGNVFALLWGYPFLVVGEGVPPKVAGLMLSLLVLGGMVVGPVLGQLAGRWPLRRSALVFTVVGSSALVWAVVLLWPGRAPLGVLLLLVVVLASNGPGSMVGFDFARTYNPYARLGSATGIVNVGGFVASLVLIGVIGVVLDLTSRGGAYGLADLRLAFALQYPLWALGLVGVWRHRRVIRRRMAREDGIVLDPLHRAVVRRLRTPDG